MNGLWHIQEHARQEKLIEAKAKVVEGLKFLMIKHRAEIDTFLLTGRLP